MKKILFIEDESALQKSFGEALEKEDYNVIKALDGQRGLDLAKKENPDLVLLDLILPKLNGFEVLEKLKDNEKTQHIPVIILTNLERAEDINKAIELGATTYLVKANYSVEEILNKVKKALE